MPTFWSEFEIFLPNVVIAHKLMALAAINGTACVSAEIGNFLSADYF